MLRWLTSHCCSIESYQMAEACGTRGWGVGVLQPPPKTFWATQIFWGNKTKFGKYFF